MADLLLELGCEELPATFTDKASADLANAVESRLQHAYGIKFTAQRYATPRRLIVAISGLPDRQPDSDKEVRGPALKAAFGPDGQPLPPLLGFCRSNGVEAAAVEQRDGYAWVVKKIEGLPTAEFLAETLPDAIRSLTFEKSMRWGSGKMRFARPIRWLLATYDGKAVEFEVEGVKSGLLSRGHRFQGGPEFEARTIDELLSGLRSRMVEPDPEARRTMIVEQSAQAAAGIPDLPDELVWENVHLTEWPSVVAGHFRSEHQQLPDPVLVTSMAKHEKMFPVRKPSGELSSQFLFVRGSGDDETVRRGAEWVLNARLDDAAFFFAEDKKLTIAEFLDKTSGIVFQAKLGTVKDRAERLHDLAAYVANWTGSGESESDLAARAGLYAKADLATGLVSEFAGLQGVIGGIYASREGFAPEICDAISRQYTVAASLAAESVSDRIGLRLCIADALDKLAGFLGIGLAPTGTSDPFGLRRAAGTLIEAAWSWPDAGKSLEGPFIRAAELYRHQGFECDIESALSLFKELLVSRYQTMLKADRHDLAEAAIAAELGDSAFRPRLVKFRLACTRMLSQDPSFIQAASRPINLLRSSEKKGEAWDTAEPLRHMGALDSMTGDHLAAAIRTQTPLVHRAVTEEDPADLVTEIRRLREPIDAFFESTMVMADDMDLRRSRLTLLQACADLLTTAGDLSKIVVSESPSEP